MAPTIATTDDLVRLYLQHRRGSNSERQDAPEYFNAIAYIYDAIAVWQEWQAPIHVVTNLFNFVQPCSYRSRKTIYVADLGCGTGLTGAGLRREWRSVSGLGNLHIIGLDSSVSMLREAAAKGVYNNIIHGNVRTLHFPTPVQIVVASGLFSPGLCGPHHLPRVLEILEPGGYLSLSVLTESEHSGLDNYAHAFETAHCNVLLHRELPYRRNENLSLIYAHYFVLHKYTSIP